MDSIVVTTATRPPAPPIAGGELRIQLSVAPDAAFLLDLAVETAQVARDLLRDARRELEHEEADPAADDLSIALARQRVFLANRRLLSARLALGHEDGLACDCC